MIPSSGRDIKPSKCEAARTREPQGIIQPLYSRTWVREFKQRRDATRRWELVCYCGGAAPAVFKRLASRKGIIKGWSILLMIFKASKHGYTMDGIHLKSIFKYIF